MRLTSDLLSIISLELFLAKFAQKITRKELKNHFLFYP